MKEISVMVDKEPVSIKVFGEIPDRAYFGFGMKKNGTVVIVKAAEDMSSSCAFATVGDVYYIRQLRRGELKTYANWKEHFHGSTEVHNFFHQHDLPEEGEAHIIKLCAELFFSYPKPVLLFKV